MSQEPIFEKSIPLPLGYVFTARARPSTIRRTVFKLLPWALVAMAPAGRSSKIAQAVAKRVSPLAKYKIS
jgi:hypothetical protein